MFVRSSAFASVVAFALVITVNGCSSEGPDLAHVSGTITLDGNPAPKLNITFTPNIENGTPSFGGTDESGQYTLHFTGDKAGAMVGKHTVQIEARAAEMDENGNVLPDQNIPEIPKRYSLENTLTAEVKPGSNTIDFTLDSAKDASDEPQAGSKSSKRIQ